MISSSLFYLFFISALIYSTAGWFLLPKIRYCREESERKIQSRQTETGSELSIIIPARNEETRLPRLLESLRSEGLFGRFEIIVVDDGSEDRTAEIAASAGCILLTAGEKPEGMQGKSWACAAGAAAASGRLLCFLDADIWFTSGGFDRVASCFKGGLMSVQPYHRFVRPYESLSSFFNLLAAAGVNSFCLQSCRRPPLGAFGPCMICSRDDYEKSGGHLAVASELVDDIALARLFVCKGMDVTNYAGRDSLEYRMYPGGFHELYEGWTKNMAEASASSSKLTGLFFGIWCAGAANIALSFAYSVAKPATLALTAGVYLFYGIQTLYNLRKIGSWNAAVILSYPIHLLFFLGLLCISGIRSRFIGRVSWKGRSIKIKK